MRLYFKNVFRNGLLKSSSKLKHDQKCKPSYFVFSVILTKIWTISNSIFISFDLQKQWEALIRRALCRASGQDPPKRGKHWKSKSDNNPDQENPEEKLTLDNLKYDTLFVDTSTDLRAIFSSKFGSETGEKMGLIGLHTCGNLAANSLQIFLANDAMKFCCNVGCCYHLLDEEFEENGDEKIPCFPLSEKLNDMKFSLGRNARMVAAQPMDRTIYNQQVLNFFLNK